MRCGAGALRGRCFNIETGEVGEDICSLGPTVWDSYDYYWTRKDMEVTAPAHVHSGGAYLCARMEEFCMQLGENSGRHTVDFDDIGHAMMSIFQIMTLEGWADLCYEIQDSVGYWHWMYFVLLIMVGPMFALQLFLVVIATRHAELTAEAKIEEAQSDELPMDEVADSNKVAPEPEDATEGEETGEDGSPLDLNAKA